MLFSEILAVYISGGKCSMSPTRQVPTLTDAKRCSRGWHTTYNMARLDYDIHHDTPACKIQIARGTQQTPCHPVRSTGMQRAHAADLQLRCKELLHFGRSRRLAPLMLLAYAHPAKQAQLKTVRPQYARSTQRALRHCRA